MILQGFHIGKKKWYVMVYYDVLTRGDLLEVKGAILSAGADEATADMAVDNLAYEDTGFTFSNLDRRLTVMLMSRASSAEQMYDTIQHELKHATEHISEFYGVDSKSEEAAYLQGEIARQMFPAAAMVVCTCSPH